MPIVSIDIQEGKTTAYKRAIFHGVRNAITSALGVAHERVMQRINETSIEDIDAPQVRSDRLTIISISMLPGRDATLKRDLYQAIVMNLGQSPGIDSHDIVVVVSDPPAECFFVNGAIQCEVPSPPQAELSE